jgi:hypothetical protein
MRWDRLRWLLRHCPLRSALKTLRRLTLRCTSRRLMAPPSSPVDPRFRQKPMTLMTIGLKTTVPVIRYVSFLFFLLPSTLNRFLSLIKVALQFPKCLVLFYSL